MTPPLDARCATRRRLFPSLEQRLDDALDRLYSNAKPTPPTTVPRIAGES